MQDITWSCNSTRAQVRDRAAHLGLRLAPDCALPTLRDIDTLQVRAGRSSCLTAVCSPPAALHSSRAGDAAGPPRLAQQHNGSRDDEQPCTRPGWPSAAAQRRLIMVAQWPVQSNGRLLPTAPEHQQRAVWSAGQYHFSASHVWRSSSVQSISSTQSSRALSRSTQSSPDLAMVIGCCGLSILPVLVFSTFWTTS